MASQMYIQMSQFYIKLACLFGIRLPVGVKCMYQHDLLLSGRGKGTVM